jgi:hypothetical protein
MLSTGVFFFISLVCHILDFSVSVIFSHVVLESFIFSQSYCSHSVTSPVLRIISVFGSFYVRPLSLQSYLVFSIQHYSVLEPFIFSQSYCSHSLTSRVLRLISVFESFYVRPLSLQSYLVFSIQHYLSVSFFDVFPQTQQDTNTNTLRYIHKSHIYKYVIMHHKYTDQD